MHNQKFTVNTYLILESFIDEVHVNGVAQERGGLGLAPLKGGLQVLLKDEWRRIITHESESIKHFTGRTTKGIATKGFAKKGIAKKGISTKGIATKGVAKKGIVKKGIAKKGIAYKRYWQQKAMVELKTRTCRMQYISKHPYFNATTYCVDVVLSEYFM